MEEEAIAMVNTYYVEELADGAILCGHYMSRGRYVWQRHGVDLQEGRKLVPPLLERCLLRMQVFLYLGRCVLH